MLTDRLLDQFEPKLKNSKRGFKRDEIRTEINEFIIQRLKARLLESGKGREIIDAVLSIKDPLDDVSDVLVRLALIESLAKTDEGLALFRVGNRIGRILQGPAGDEVSASLFSEDAEKKLWEKFSTEVEAVLSKEDHAGYEKTLKLLTKVTPEIDVFFDKVMVNDPDEKKRANRRALLNRMYKHFAAVADFPKLQPIIPGGQP